jgi:hypothetical protein
MGLQISGVFQQKTGSTLVDLDKASSRSDQVKAASDFFISPSHRGIASKGGSDASYSNATQPL